jgi:hypothetical protein
VSSLSGGGAIASGGPGDESPSAFLGAAARVLSARPVAYRAAVAAARAAPPLVLSPPPREALLDAAAAARVFAAAGVAAPEPVFALALLALGAAAVDPPAAPDPDLRRRFLAAEGRAAAAGVDRHLMGHTALPAPIAPTAAPQR